jgi:hypothetical protein
MDIDLEHSAFLRLHAEYVKRNKLFTEAIKEKRSHPEVKSLYQEVQHIYEQLLHERSRKGFPG